MRKSFIFAVVGAGLFFTGCHDSIMGDHRYQPVPVDDIPYDTPAARPQPQPVKTVVEPTVLTPPDTPPARPAPSVPQYKPMSNVKSSGGVDSVRPRKTSDTSQKAAPAGTHIVKRGETPGHIARKYGVSLNAFMKANNLTEESAKKLRVNQKLIIPAKSASSPRQVAQKPLAKGQYRVQKGDTPDRIARKHGVKLPALMKANNLTEESARKLRVNQILIIPGSDSVAAARQSTGKKDPQPKVVSGSKTVPADDIKAVERYEQKIYVSTEDTTYAELAKKYGITEAQLRHINGIMTGEISMGTEVIVPIK